MIAGVVLKQQLHRNEAGNIMRCIWKELVRAVVPIMENGFDAVRRILDCCTSALCDVVFLQSAAQTTGNLW